MADAAGQGGGQGREEADPPTKVKGHKVAASAEDPQYLVVSDTSGKEAAHKPAALKPRRAS